MIDTHNKDIILKKPDTSDMDAIKRWYSMTDDLHHATGAKEFSEIAQLIEYPEKTNSLVFIIREPKSNYNIGFTYANINKFDHGTILWIKTLLIDPKYQGKGFGTAAIDKLLAYTQSSYQWLTSIVTVSDNNTKGISFWEKVGFSRCSELESILHHGGTSGVSVLKKYK